MTNDDDELFDIDTHDMKTCSSKCL